jgi:hypothetical protein
MMNNLKAPKRARYSKDSDRLWEEGPVCPNSGNYKVTYKSTHLNSYQEPVFYKNNKESNRVLPTVSTDVPGFFNAYPGGLNIDQYTGEIDINDSDAGMRYTVEFSPCGKDCVMQTIVVISGIGYRGGFFSLSKKEIKISPFYLGSIVAGKISSENLPPGEFGKYLGPGKEPTADLLGLEINHKTGTINLQKTIDSGALGFRKNKNGSYDKYPANGTSKDFRIYYQVHSGPGEGVLNSIKIRIHFYDTEKDMPDDLKARLRQQDNSLKRRSFPLPLLLGIPLAAFPDWPLGGADGLTSSTIIVPVLNVKSPGK